MKFTLDAELVEMRIDGIGTGSWMGWIVHGEGDSGRDVFWYGWRFWRITLVRASFNGLELIVMQHVIRDKVIATQQLQQPFFRNPHLLLIKGCAFLRFISDLGCKAKEDVHISLGYDTIRYPLSSGLIFTIKPPSDPH